MLFGGLAWRDTNFNSFVTPTSVHGAEYLIGSVTGTVTRSATHITKVATNDRRPPSAASCTCTFRLRGDVPAPVGADHDQRSQNIATPERVLSSRSEMAEQAREGDVT